MNTAQPVLTEHSHRSRRESVSNLDFQMMSPRKHPPEGAQNGTLAPAIGRAAAAHGAHTLDETPHNSKEQIQAHNPPNHPRHHAHPHSLEGFDPFTEYGLTEHEPTEMQRRSQYLRRCRLPASVSPPRSTHRDLDDDLSSPGLGSAALLALGRQTGSALIDVRYSHRFLVATSILTASPPTVRRSDHDSVTGPTGSQVPCAKSA
jgi:hypothetical protein